MVPVLGTAEIKDRAKEKGDTEVTLVYVHYRTDLKTFPLYHNVRLCHLLEVEDGAVGVDMLPLWVGATVVVMVALPVVGSQQEHIP